MNQTQLLGHEQDSQGGMPFSNALDTVSQDIPFRNGSSINFKMDTEEKCRTTRMTDFHSKSHSQIPKNTFKRAESRKLTNRRNSALAKSVANLPKPSIGIHFVANDHRSPSLGARSIGQSSQKAILETYDPRNLKKPSQYTLKMQYKNL